MAKPMGKEKFDSAVFNKQFPVLRVKYFKRGTLLIERGNECPVHLPTGIRGSVNIFSRYSRERLAMTAVESKIDFCTMITLTYGPQFPDNGKESKLHLAKFLRGMRRVFGSFDYLWFMEFTKRGRVHYHILTDIRAGHSAYERECLASLWVESQCLEMYPYSRLKDRRVVRVAEEVFKVHKHAKAWEILREKNAAARYTLKYALKMEQKVVPKLYRNCGRFWGTSKPVKESMAQNVNLNEAELREFLSTHAPGIEDWDILPRIIFSRE